FVYWEGQPKCYCWPEGPAKSCRASDSAALKGILYRKWYELFVSYFFAFVKFTQWTVSRPPYFYGIAILQSNPSKPSQGLLIALPLSSLESVKKSEGLPKWQASTLWVCNTATEPIKSLTKERVKWEL
ncbi:unnamed protein product, partial [Meganyctiphanes norvegica]